MSVREALEAQAYAEFDRLARDTERGLRERLAAIGKSDAEITAALVANLPNIAAQRATVPTIVAEALRNAGHGEANENDDS
jgi:hypothetical protein